MGQSSSSLGCTSTSGGEVSDRKGGGEERGEGLTGFFVSLLQQSASFFSGWKT